MVLWRGQGAAGRQALLPSLISLVVGALGGAVFWLLSLPLAFMLGALFVTMLTALLGARPQVSAGLRPWLLALVGTLLGTGVTPETAAQVLRWWPSLLGLLAFVALAAAGAIWLARRWAGLDPRTAFFAGMPGGFSEMVLLAEDNGADVRVVALIHVLRVTMIAFTVPALAQWLNGAPVAVAGAGPGVSLATADAGFWIWFPLTMVLGMAAGRLLRLPAPYILGPLALSCLLHGGGLTDFRIPVELIIAAQIGLGTMIGARFRDSRPAELLRLLPLTLLSAVWLLGMTLLFAWATAGALGLDLIAVLLAYSPGGFAEMGMMAFALGADPGFVALHHLIRMTAINLCVPLVLRRRRG